MDGWRPTRLASNLNIGVATLRSQCLGNFLAAQRPANWLTEGRLGEFVPTITLFS